MDQYQMASQNVAKVKRVDRKVQKGNEFQCNKDA